MTQSTTTSPEYDFSNEPSQVDVEMAKSAAKKAIKDALPSEGLVPTPKAAKTSPAKKSGKAGRVVGISADENKFLYELLQAVLFDNNYATMINDSQIAFDKLLARYNDK